LLKDELYQDGLSQRVSRYITDHKLYQINDSISVRENFIYGWYRFLDLLLPKFPELKLLEASDPSFNPAQHQLAWQEKYIRTVVKSLNLKGNDLLRFVNEARSL
jgi:hypothetical protein